MIISKTLSIRFSHEEAELDGKLAFIDDITQRNVELDGEVERLTLLVEQHGRIIGEKEREAAEHVQALEAARRPKEGVLPLENMQPVETALVLEYARLMGITPKAVLVEKLFVPTVWHGPGDYIPRLNGSAKRKIREAFQ